MHPAHTERMLKTAHRQISRWAGNSKSWLRRDGQDRVCIAVVLDVNPRDRDLVMQGVKRVLIAGYGLAVEPDREADTFVFQAQGTTEKLLYNFFAPIRGPRPAGVAIYHECEVIYDTRDV